MDQRRDHISPKGGIPIAKLLNDAGGHLSQQCEPAEQVDIPRHSHKTTVDISALVDHPIAKLPLQQMPTPKFHVPFVRDTDAVDRRPLPHIFDLEVVSSSRTSHTHIPSHSQLEDSADAPYEFSHHLSGHISHTQNLSNRGKKRSAPPLNVECPQCRFPDNPPHARNCGCGHDLTQVRMELGIDCDTEVVTGPGKGRKQCPGCGELIASRSMTCLICGYLFAKRTTGT